MSLPSLPSRFTKPDPVRIRSQELSPPPSESLKSALSSSSDVLNSWDNIEDPGNPRNWSTKKRCYVTALLSTMAVSYTIASSILGLAAHPLSREYDISYTSATLGMSFFAMGASGGSLFWGPLSERYGRRYPTVISWIGFLIFHIPAGVASNITTVFLSRLLCGFFGVAIVIIGGGILSDIWDSQGRALAATIFMAGNFAGPLLGPIAGAAIVTSPLGWRWTLWASMIPAAALLLLAICTLPESYSLVIFQGRAREIRYRDRRWGYHSLLDEERTGFRDICTRYLFRPFQMLCRDLLLLLVAIYLTFVYGLLYLLCEAYPIAFGEVRRWSLSRSTLPLLVVSLGIILGGALVIWHTMRQSRRKVRIRGRIIRLQASYSLDQKAEERLPPMIVGGLVLPIGMFWFASTSAPTTSWVPQAASGTFTGCGILMISLQGLNYVMDIYVESAASAISAISCFRCVAAAVTPLFAPQMYHGLGVGWASATLGFISLALAPVPMCFLRWGRALRDRVGPNNATIHPALRQEPAMSVRRLSVRMRRLKRQIPVV